MIQLAIALLISIPCIAVFYAFLVAFEINPFYYSRPPIECDGDYDEDFSRMQQNLEDLLGQIDSAFEELRRRDSD